MSSEATEASRWEELQARWGEEGAHRAYLDAFRDLEGLARAGQRYRAHLQDHPGDPVAERWLKEVVKRATVHGLASLPRSRPPRELPRWLKRALLLLLGSGVAWALYRIVQLLTTVSPGR